MKKKLVVFLSAIILLALPISPHSAIVYSSDVTVSKYANWQKNTLNVYIQDNSDTIKNIFNEWNAKTGNIFSFNFIQSPKNADILVVFTDKQYKNYGALTEFYYQNDSFIKTIINLPVSNFNGNFYNDKLKIFVIKHEAGHSLGIKNHSDNKYDVMFPYKTEFNNDITDNDAALLKNAKNSKPSQNIQNNKTTKTHDLPYYADLYKQQGNYEEAIKLYDILLEKNPDLTQAIYSKGLCKYKQKKYYEAYLLLNKAYSKDPDNIVFLNSYIKILCLNNKQKQAKKILKDYIKHNPQAKDDTLIYDCIRVLKQ